MNTFVQPRPQSATENCTWHNFNVVPTYKGYYGVSGNYEMGISVFDFTNTAAVQQIGYADPAEYTPGATNTQPTAGNWSTHFYNGRIYESDIRRGVLIWNLDHDAMRRVRQVDLSNPQTQMTSFAQDLEGAAITIAQPVEGAQFKQGQAQTVTYSCTDSDSGVESCAGPVASGGALDTSKIGVHEFKVTAVDRAGNVTTKSVTYMVNSADFPGTVSGNVPATLALSLGTAANFGAFTPGVAREYTATTSGNVISSAGNATLSRLGPERDQHRQAGQRHVHARQPADGLGHRRGRDGRRRRSRRLKRRSDHAADVLGPDLELGAGADVQAVDRRQRGPANGQLQQDADVHAQHDRSVGRAFP